MVLSQIQAAPFDKLRLCDKAANALRHECRMALANAAILDSEAHRPMGRD